MITFHNTILTILISYYSIIKYLNEFCFVYSKWEEWLCGLYWCWTYCQVWLVSAEQSKIYNQIVIFQLSFNVNSIILLVSITFDYGISLTKHSFNLNEVYLLVYWFFISLSSCLCIFSSIKPIVYPKTSYSSTDLDICMSISFSIWFIIYLSINLHI